MPSRGRWHDFASSLSNRAVHLLAEWGRAGRSDQVHLGKRPSSSRRSRWEEAFPQQMLVYEMLLNTTSEWGNAGNLLILFPSVDEKCEQKLDQSESRSGLAKDSD